MNHYSCTTVELKEKETHKLYRTFGPFHRALSQLKLIIQSWKISEAWPSYPTSSFPISSIIWEVTVVNVWWNCHYLPHWLWDLSLFSLFSLLRNSFEPSASPLCQPWLLPTPPGLCCTARGCARGYASVPLPILAPFKIITLQLCTTGALTLLSSCHSVLHSV